jgi:hypothetical protein
MNLYVWKDVLCDWGCGMIVALAPDMDTALKMARACEYASAAQEMGRVEPEVIEVLAPATARLWAVHGSGA